MFLLAEARHYRTTNVQMLALVRTQASFVIATTAAVAGAGGAGGGGESSTLTTVATFVSALAVLFSLRAHVPGMRGAILTTNPAEAVGYFENAVDVPQAIRALAKDIHGNATETQEQLVSIRGHVVIAFIFALTGFPLWVINAA